MPKIEITAGFAELARQWDNLGMRKLIVTTLLALFAVTLLKVVTIDMSQVSTGYRILSFVGLGGLLLVTSVLYGKLSPVLLKELAPDNSASS